jgi:hypothetical protein
MPHRMAHPLAKENRAGIWSIKTRKYAVSKFNIYFIKYSVISKNIPNILKCGGLRIYGETKISHFFDLSFALEDKRRKLGSFLEQHGEDVL